MNGFAVETALCTVRQGCFGIIGRQAFVGTSTSEAGQHFLGDAWIKRAVVVHWQMIFRRLWAVEDRVKKVSFNLSLGQETGKRYCPVFGHHATC